MPPILPPPEAPSPGIAVFVAAQVLAVVDVARLGAPRLALVVEGAGLVDRVAGVPRWGRHGPPPVAADLDADRAALRVLLLAGRERALQAVVVAHRCSAFTPRYSSIAR